MNKRIVLGVISLLLLILLTACGTDSANSGETKNGNNTGDSATVLTNEDVDKANQADKEENTLNSDTTNTGTPPVIPEGMKEAQNQKFKVGDQVTVNAEHEIGMKGSVGTVLGAYDTIVYSVSYTPTDGDYAEENHKWVVHEELQGLDAEMLVPGAEIIIETNQEEAMLGAQGEIDTAEKTIAYMVEYTTADGITYKKWFKESELSAK